MNSDDTCLTAATADDVTEITNLYLATRSDALPYLPRLHTNEQVRDWIANTVIRRCRVWVARGSGRILGFLALDGDYLDQLYVRPGYYRQGIGSRLLALAKRESSGRLRLHIFQRNAIAKTFYEAHGFRVMDCNDGSRNEEREPDVQYEWTLISRERVPWKGPGSVSPNPNRPIGYASAILTELFKGK